MHYNVAPRYSGGSPAQVDQRTAERVAADERAAYPSYIEGFHGADGAVMAMESGLRGIVECRIERVGAWEVIDLITNERFARPFEAPYNESPLQMSRRLQRLRSRFQHLEIPLERDLPCAGCGFPQGHDSRCPKHDKVYQKTWPSFDRSGTMPQEEWDAFVKRTNEG